ncbi:MAG TPA: thioredoxin [Clostridia bacterium]|nr:thioredoxin [Clostridia bacterium]
MSIINLNKDSFEEEVLKSDKPVLIDFWATWCHPCRMLAPIIEELAHEIGEQAKICKVDVDTESFIAEDYGIKSIPTVLIFKNKEVVETFVGVKSKENLKQAINKHI